MDIGSWILLITSLLAIIFSVFFVSPGFVLFLKRLYESTPDDQTAPVPFNKIHDFRQVLVVLSITRMTILFLAGLLFYLTLDSLGLEITVAGTVTIVAIVLFLIILISEVLAEILITRPNHSIANLIGFTMIVTDLVLTPVLKLIMWVSRLLANQFATQTTDSPQENRDFEKIMEEERVRHQLEEDERRMIEGIVDLHEMTVREVMVPRIDVEFIEVTTDYQSAIDFINQEGYSRIPVYDGTVDNIVGILYAKDLLKPGNEEGSAPAIRDMLRSAYFVPDSKNVTQMLREFLQNRVHFAIVVDEYGGTAGILTLEDIIEEIVGEIQDEHDIEEPLLRVLDAHTCMVDAKMDLDDLGELLWREFDEDEDFETLGGLILDHLGRVPDLDEELEIDGIKMKIEEVDGRRISWVRITSEQPLHISDEIGKKHSSTDDEQPTQARQPVDLKHSAISRTSEAAAQDAEPIPDSDDESK